MKKNVFITLFLLISVMCFGQKQDVKNKVDLNVGFHCLNISHKSLTYYTPSYFTAELGYNITNSVGVTAKFDWILSYGRFEKYKELFTPKLSSKSINIRYKPFIHDFIKPYVKVGYMYNTYQTKYIEHNRSKLYLPKENDNNDDNFIVGLGLDFSLSNMYFGVYYDHTFKAYKRLSKTEYKCNGIGVRFGIYL